MNISISWASLKTIASSKNINFNYIDETTYYVIWCYEGGVFYKALIDIDDTPNADQIDFETNYKASANISNNIFEDELITNLAITDTTAHYSVISDLRGYVPKTIIIENTLDKSVDVQVQVSRRSDFSMFIDCGNSLNVLSNTMDYVTLNDYFPYMRIKVSCAVAPTSGDVSVFIEKVK